MLSVLVLADKNEHKDRVSRFAFFPLLCALVAAAIYGPSLGYDFAYDDLWQIMRNPIVTNSEVSYWQAAITPTAPGNLYRPIAILSYKATWQLFGATPLYFHLGNILLYALLCFLGAKLIMAVIGDGWLSLAAAVLYTLHPLHVECVANVVGRAEMLAAIFGMLHIFALSRASAQAKLRGVYLSLAVATLVLGVLSKESALTFALLAPLYGVLVDGRKGLGQSVVCGFLGATIALGLRYLALGSGFFDSESQLGFVAENPLAALDFSQRLLPALTILGSYLELTIFPWRLSADYSLMADQFFERIYSLQGLGWAALLLLFLGLIWRFRHEKLCYFGVWFFASFALTANIFWPIGTVQAERLSLMPSLGALVFLFVAAARLLGSEKNGKILAISLAALFMILTLQRAPVWRDNLTLFERTALDAAQSPKAMFNYGIELYARGQKDLAEPALRKALDLNPNHLAAARALADLLLEKRDYGRVEYWYRRILSLDPNDTKVQAALEQLLKLKQK